MASSSPPVALCSLTSPSSSHSGTLPTRRRQRVTAEHTLNRVRENQRRHRARRKDYIASLEQKLAEAEKQLSAARAEIAALKALHEAHAAQCDKSAPPQATDTLEAASNGITEEDSNAPEDNAVIALTPSLLSPTPLPRPDLQDAAFLGSFYMTDSLDLSLPLNLSSIPSSSAPSSSTVPTSPEPSPTLPTGPPPCCEPTPALPPPDPADPECTSCKTRPAPAPSESTTLCAQAYVMIQQQNFRGIDAATIRLWLISGFRRAQRAGEGCRVENGALFRLLDYISGV